MKSISKLAVISVFSFLAVGCSFLATQDTLNVAAIENAEILNLKHPESVVFSSGQPTQEQLDTLSTAGIKHVINLRTAGELEEWDEREYVESLGGVTYHSIPVQAPNDINVLKAASLQALLKSFGDEPVLLHCGSGNRAGALVAVIEGELEGKDADAAVEEGKRWGLTRLEPAVREVLSE